MQYGVTIKFPTGLETGVRDKQVQVSKTNGYGWLTDLERASDRTGTDRTTAVASCRECRRIPVNNTNMQVKSNESAYNGVTSC